MQTSRQVIENLLRNRPAERVGVMDSIWSDALRDWTAQGYPVDDDGHPVDPVDHFGYDLAGVGGWFDLHPLRGPEEVVEETDEWVVKRNGSGAALKWWKNKSGTPEHIDFRMTSREIWERDYRPHLLSPDPARVDVEDARKRLARRRARNVWAHYGHLFIWEGMRQSMGDIALYENLILDPGWIRDYNRVYTDLHQALYRVLFEQAGLPDGVWMYEDLGYRDRLFCSPQICRDLLFPYYREMVDFFHSFDLPVVLHSCGCVTEALPLIADAGFDGLNPMEVKAGCDTLAYAARYRDTFVFFGGLDARVLESGDRALIRREVARLVDGMKSLGARYVFGSDHSISTNVSYDAYRWALDACRERISY